MAAEIIAKDEPPEIPPCAQTKTITLGDYAEAIVKCGLVAHSKMVRHHAVDEDEQQNLIVHYLWE